MKRRAFVGRALAALTLAGCSRNGPAEIALSHHTAEELLARVKANGAAKKATALHFWATWCGPCIEEFPLLEREWRGWIKDEPRLDFLAVSVDEPDHELAKEQGADAAAKKRDDAVRRFVREQGTSFPLAVAVSDTPETFAMTIDEGWPAVLPTTILFGFDGTVAMRQLGELRVSRFRDKVSTLLK